MKENINKIIEYNIKLTILNEILKVELISFKEWYETLLLLREQYDLLYVK